MKPRRRTVVPAALAGALALAAGLFTGNAPQAVAAQGLAAPVIAWHDCDDGFQCADVPVPLDYDRPADGTISLALLRLPSTDPAHRRGSLFVNPGGPGGSGVGALRFSSQSYPQAVRAAYDLIGFDPRGIGGSTPLRCFDDQQQALAYQYGRAFPVTAAEEAAWEGVDRVLVNACAAKNAPILSHMSTANVARDLDLLRRAVGDARLNFLGYSYGSYLGTTYANLFPSTVGALVIDGVLDPIQWATGNGATARKQPFTDRILSARGSEDSLQQFFTLCDQAGARCALSGSAKARYDALLARARVSPIPYPGLPSFRLGADGIIAATVGGLSGPQWSSFAGFLAALEAEPPPTSPASPLEIPPVEGNAYTQVEGRAAVMCTETDNPASASAWVTAADKSAVHYPYFGRYWTWDSSVCSNWPAKDADRYAGPWRVTTSNPVLVVGNYFDPSTPYEDAVVTSRLLENSRLLSYAGWGHSAYLKAGSTCVDDAVTRYLVSGVLPDRGTVCQPHGTPFDAPATPLPLTPLTPPTFL